jgi:prevent-host-death family protein
MKTATVRDLRNHYTQLLAWIEAGEEIVITRRGKSVARLVPETPQNENKVDWNESPAVTRGRTTRHRLSAKDAKSLLNDSGGKW